MLMEYVDRYPDVLHVAERANIHRIAGHAWRGLLIGVAVMLAGCVSDVGPLDPSDDPRPPTAATVEPVEHQLRIVAVDFDPSLDYAQIVSNNGVTLMVAVENQGLYNEANVRVSARLLDPAAAPDALPILDETIVLTDVMPGQIRVARFSHDGDFMLLSSYRLEVAVDPVPDELQTDDNYRTYEVVVPGSE